MVEVPNDQGPAVQSKLLRDELVRLRRERELTQDEVARELDWSAAKMIRLEGGKNPIQKSDLQVLLGVYGVDSRETIDRLQELAAGARQPAWWSTFKSDFPDAYLSYIGYEAGAASIKQSQHSTVPGLLQTEEYADAIGGGTNQAIRTRFRLRRQEELELRSTPPARHFLLDEAVIRRHVGVQEDAGLMPRQLRHVTEVVRANELVTVQVVPFSAGQHEGMRGAFTILEFEGDLGDVLFLESRQETVTVIGDDERISDHKEAFESIRDIALSPAASLQLIESMIAQMTEAS
ncbi:helix-turn-helix transcriptional regulator [Actinocorallia longicatena]|uniref:Helix-turn-helix transcriptional regulator n=1 Tax=Actinocorallia longicatena TaxID=111803 RepID=A0ABP6QFY0_9ACTN